MIWYLEVTIKISRRWTPAVTTRLGSLVYIPVQFFLIHCDFDVFFYYKWYLFGKALIVLAQYLLYWNCVTILSTGLSGIPFQSVTRNLWTTAFCQCLNIWTVSSLMGIQNWPLNYRAAKWSHKKPWKGGPGGVVVVSSGHWNIGPQPGARITGFNHKSQI